MSATLLTPFGLHSTTFLCTHVARIVNTSSFDPNSFMSYCLAWNLASKLEVACPCFFRVPIASVHWWVSPRPHWEWLRPLCCQTHQSSVVTFFITVLSLHPLFPHCWGTAHGFLSSTPGACFPWLVVPLSWLALELRYWVGRWWVLRPSLRKPAPWFQSPSVSRESPCVYSNPNVCSALQHM